MWNLYALPTCTSYWGTVVSEAGSYLRLIDPCITQLKAQGPSRTCNESNEEEEEAYWGTGVHGLWGTRVLGYTGLGLEV